MEKKVKIIDANDVPPVPFHFVTNHTTLAEGYVESRRLVTKKKDGSERMSFHVNRVKGGSNFQGIVYSDTDEINYMIEGEGTVIFDGESHKVLPGMAWYVPAGKTVTYVSHKDSVHVLVFSPPRE